jgi:hypothetical protein
VPAGDHDLSVHYADEVVPGAAIDLGSWECWAQHDGSVTHFYARGPCPACHAIAQGHADDIGHPLEPLGRDEAPKPVPEGAIEIPVRCTCGDGHGHDGATGCGRRWSIVCPAAER